MEKEKKRYWSRRVEKLTSDGYDLIHRKIFPRKIPDDLWSELHTAMRTEGYKKIVLVPRDNGDDLFYWRKNKFSPFFSIFGPNCETQKMREKFINSNDKVIFE